MSGYRISDVAERTGVPATTLRYYEGIGIMPAAERTASGYRVYDDRTIARLDFIAGAKQLGLTLEELRALVGLWDGDQCGPVQQEMARLVNAKVSESARRAAELAAFADELRGIAVRLAAEPHDGPCDDACACTSVTSPMPAARPIAFVAKPRAETAADEPIACTLGGAADIAERVDDWRRLLAKVTGREAIDGGLRLSFPSSPDVAADVARLASAEVACCSWIDVALHLTVNSTILDVTAPPAGQQILASLFGVAS